MTLADAPGVPGLGPTLPDLMVPACAICGHELLHPTSWLTGICAYRDEDHDSARQRGWLLAPRWIAARSRTVLLCSEHQNVVGDDGLCHRCVG